LLIWHSKYSAIYTPTDCFFGDFAHWDVIEKFVVENLSAAYKRL